MSETHAIFFKPPLEDNYLGHQVKEIYFDKVYAPFLQNRLNTVLDIGGNIGMTSYYFSQHADRVVTLEPAAEHFQTLQEMVKFNKLDNVELVNRALYIKEGKFDFHHNKNKTMYSLHQAVSDNSGSEPVECVSLKTLFESKNIDQVDLMKLDIEGSEIEVFSHSDFKELAPRIKTIITERHAWSGRHPNQLNDALKIAGYTIQQATSDADLVIATR